VSRASKLIAVAAGGVGGVAILSASVLGFAAAQAAGGHPRVTGDLVQSDLSAGLRPQLRYDVSGAPHHSDLVIQSSTGAGWKTAARLSLPAHSSGRWTGPDARRGRYRYRLQVDQGSDTLATSPVLTLYVYGIIPLSAVLGTQVASVTIGGHSFSYAWKAAGWESDTIAQIAATSCRSLQLTMAYTQRAAANVADVATLLVIQQTRTATGNVTAGTIGTLKANLTGAFEIALQNAPGSAYGNGTASCWSSDGRA
jgi:hypothetical protein